MARSGQITVATAGTAVQGTNTAGTEFILKGHPDNTGAVFVGNDDAGDVTSSNGFALDPGESIPIKVPNLNALWFDAAENGDVVCWIKYW